MLKQIWHAQISNFQLLKSPVVYSRHTLARFCYHVNYCQTFRDMQVYR